MKHFTARAPGRVNLIGEHTDYNEGFVMPAAIGYETVASASPRDDRTVAIASQATSSDVEIDLDDLGARRAGDWTDYARGVVIELARAGVPLRGATMQIGGNLPIGAGLSSSASFEVALALAMLDVSGATLEPMEIVQLCHRAEVDHVGAHSGIMDQFAVLFGQVHHVTMLDTRTLGYEHLPIPSGCRIIIANTMVRHALAGGEYNVRREQCEQAVKALRQWYPEVRALRDVSLEELQAHENDLSPVIFRRARHVITENQRVRQTAAALRKRDLKGVGALMYASHASLCSDYEVSSSELDVMVEIARHCHGVYGARMTGGGFGGCTVNLVDGDDAQAFVDRVAAEYRERVGVTPEFYDGTPVRGASNE